MTIDAEESAEFLGWPEVFTRLFSRVDLSTQQAMATFGEILAGRAEPAQIAAFVAALRAKGETAEEIAGFVAAMRAAGERVSIDVEAIDTCGTGGDRSTTINVSTTAAFVAVGAGAIVAKHGGRAASSQSGSADVLEALGVVIELGPNQVATCVRDVGIGFCFAPRFHPAMRFAAPVRSALGVPTVFNILGPLANPAGVTRQVIGVGDARMAEKMVGVLEAFGTKHAIVCYGNDGLDELSTVTTSTVYETRATGDGGHDRRCYQLDPTSFGIAPATLADLQGANAAHNAERMRLVLKGEQGAQRDIVLLNSAAALVVADIAVNIEDGLTKAATSIDSGAALIALEGLVQRSNQLAD